MTGTVYLVGAGPGDPELLTLRAARLLATADVVLHDDLVPAEVLAMVYERALVTSVGKRCGRARITQAGINRMMVDAARAGQMVVRLKAGDPLVFGRAGEELRALASAGIRVEVVPGISAAFAAAAFLRLPLTDRLSASKLIFIAGRHAAEKGAPAIWSGDVPSDSTLVIYMPGRDFSLLAAELRRAGVSGDMPCVSVVNAGRDSQSVAGCRLGELEGMEASTGPMLMLVGRAMEGLVEGTPLPGTLLRKVFNPLGLGVD